MAIAFRTALAVALLSGVLAESAAAQLVFVAEPFQSPGFKPSDLLVADVDTDGDNDVLERQGQEIVTYLGDGSGGFAAGSTARVFVGDFGVPADFDKDGNLDVVVVDYGSVTVRFGAGDGSFPTDVYLHEPYAGSPDRLHSIQAVITGDVDGDARPDLVVVQDDPGRVTVLRARADHGFDWIAPTALSGVVRDGVWTDVDGDQHTDVAVTTSTGLRVLQGQASGAMAAPVEVSAGDRERLLEADVDGDGTTEVISWDFDLPTVVTVWEPGQGTLQAGHSLQVDTVASYTDAAVGDLDQDGAEDVVLAGHWDDHVLALFGDADDGLLAPVELVEVDAFTYPEQVAVGDLTGDAFDDVLIDGYWLARNSPWMDFSTWTLPFASLQLGQTSPPQRITAVNTALAPLQISGVTVDGDQFRIVSDGCSGETLELDATCAVDVVFAPTVDGPAQGWVDYDSNDPHSPLSVELVGEGIAASVVQPPAPVSPPPADTTAPSLRLAGALSQRVLRQRGVFVVAACPAEACTATAKGKVVVRGSAKAFKLTPVTKQIAEGGKAALKLKIKRKALSAIGRALKKEGRVTAKVTVTAKDAAGNVTTKQRNVRLKP